MRRNGPVPLFVALVLGTGLVAGLSLSQATRLYAKEKAPPMDPNDPTYRLFQLLDAARVGRLADFYLIADVYKDPVNPNDELQHILRADYDKNRGFGRLNLYIRSVGKIAPEQLKVYTAKDFYEFGLSDQEKFIKTDPGPFGKPGDVYFRAVGDRPLASAPVTEELRKAYEVYLTRYLLPALERK